MLLDFFKYLRSRALFGLIISCLIWTSDLLTNNASEPVSLPWALSHDPQALGSPHSAHHQANHGLRAHTVKCIISSETDTLWVPQLPLKYVVLVDYILEIDLESNCDQISPFNLLGEIHLGQGSLLLECNQESLVNKHGPVTEDQLLSCRAMVKQADFCHIRLKQGHFQVLRRYSQIEFEGLVILD